MVGGWCTTGRVGVIGGERRGVVCMEGDGRCGLGVCLLGVCEKGGGGGFEKLGLGSVGCFGGYNWYSKSL